MADAIRCSRCDQHLPPDAFAPSHRKQGGWCRACRKAYHHHRNAIEAATKPRTCKRCGGTFTKWDTYDSGGTSRTHCRPCYNEKARLAYWAKKGGRPEPKPVQPYGKAQGKAWNALRARVFTEEAHCWICNERVDQTLSSLHKLGRTVDHVMPTSLGGANTRDNLRLAHRSCNAARGDARDERIKYLRLALAMSTIL